MQMGESNWKHFLKPEAKPEIGRMLRTDTQTTKLKAAWLPLTAWMTKQKLTSPRFNVTCDPVTINIWPLGSKS